MLSMHWIIFWFMDNQHVIFRILQMLAFSQEFASLQRDAEMKFVHIGLQGYFWVVSYAGLNRDHFIAYFTQWMLWRSPAHWMLMELSSSFRMHLKISAASADQECNDFSSKWQMCCLLKLDSTLTFEMDSQHQCERALEFHSQNFQNVEESSIKLWSFSIWQSHKQHES